MRSSDVQKGSASDAEMHLRANIRFQKLVDPIASFLLPLAEVDDFVPQSLIARRGVARASRTT